MAITVNHWEKVKEGDLKTKNENINPELNYDAFNKFQFFEILIKKSIEYAEKHRVDYQTIKNHYDLLKTSLEKIQQGIVILEEIGEDTYSLKASSEPSYKRLEDLNSKAEKLIINLGTEKRLPLSFAFALVIVLELSKGSKESYEWLRQFMQINGPLNKWMEENCFNEKINLPLVSPQKIEDTKWALDLKRGLWGNIVSAFQAKKLKSVKRDEFYSNETFKFFQDQIYILEQTLREFDPTSRNKLHLFFFEYLEGCVDISFWDSIFDNILENKMKRYEKELETLKALTEDIDLYDNSDKAILDSILKTYESFDLRRNPPNPSYLDIGFHL